MPKIHWTQKTLSRRLIRLQNLKTHLTLILAFSSLLTIMPGIDGFKTANGEPRKLFGGYRITPKQCRATKTLPRNDPRSDGPTICMFNHECAQRNGEVVGACMDGFLFGACCQVPKAQEPESTLINDAQNTFYHQFQQQKLQQHESETNKFVSQAYESFAENSAQNQFQSQESAVNQAGLEEDFDRIHNNYDSQMQHDTLEDNSGGNSDTSTEGLQYFSSSVNTDSNSESSTEFQAYTPPKLNVHIDSNTISNAAQVAHNDDFVLHAIHDPYSEGGGSNNHLSLTTEIPNKIVSSLAQHISSESDSFEDQRPGILTAIADTNVHQYAEHSSENEQQQQVTDAFLNSVTFSHSDITHPAADSVLVEDDLQFSTGYGPEPVFVAIPSKHNLSHSISEKIDSSYFGPSSTTPSAITTHVDSIETIIQQLNHTNLGPAYNVINSQSSTFAYEITNSTKSPSIGDDDLSTLENEHNEKQTPTPINNWSFEEPSTNSDQYVAEIVPEDHTVPETGYNDHMPSSHQTSDFNKMPNMGIAYPVDMSHMGGEETNSIEVSEHIVPQESYTPNKQHSNFNSNQPQPQPISTYMGVVTSQSYNTPQVPHEVVVSSHTTKVEEGLHTSVVYVPITATTNKITTVAHHPTTIRPVKITSKPNLITKKPGNKKPAKNPSNKVTLSTSSYPTYPTTETKTQPPPGGQYTIQHANSPASVSFSHSQHSGSTAKPATTRKPTRKQTQKPISTSYVTGPTTPRPIATAELSYGNRPSFIATDDKLDSFVYSTAQSLASVAPAQDSSSYADAPIPVLRPQSQYNTHKKPGFVKIPLTQRPPAPTVLITPRPIKTHTASSSLSSVQQTTPIPPTGSTAYIYNQLVTKQPGFGDNGVGDYVGITTVNSNDFDDPGYYGTSEVIKPQPHPQLVFVHPSTEGVYSVPSDDKPAFPGYYGPTPTYPAFQVPGEKINSQIEEETYTSPNDFVNFPPVRNPNLNMSATSSAVTSDFELSTPAFVEDSILKNKMNTLVHKIVESLQGNFEALADMIDETNNTAAILSYQASPPTTTAGPLATKRPTRKSTKATTPKPKATTKKPATRLSTKAPTKRPTSTRRPETTTKKPVARRTTTTTRKPATRKPTRRPTTTTKLPADDELVDEEDGDDINPSENEINAEDEAQYGAGAGGRKIQCGVRPHMKSGRIVGGKGATFGAYPWQVLVRESTWLGLFTKNKCGGVLITNRYVITAAHCQPGFLASLVAVMGEFDISGDLESKRAITKNVKRVIVHRQYDPATFENDIALLELDSSVQFDTHIVPICMPTDVADFTGRMATVTGWGRLKYGGGVPSVLQEVQVPVIENSVCQEMFHTAGHNKKILGSFLCAGYANGQKDSCEGDSGGPLVLQRPDGRYELAGTVSHGIKCAAPYLPGVYMRTTYYKPWLRSITGVK